MSRLLSYLRDKHTLWYKLALIIACIASIVALLPGTNYRSFNFTPGKTWEHDDLVSPADFAVYKSEAELAREKEDMKAHAPFFYYCDQTQLRKNIEEFFKNRELPGPEKSKVTLFFDSLLARNIIDLPDSGSSRSPVWVLNGNEITEASLNSFLTIPQADSLLYKLVEGASPQYEKTIIPLLENTLTHTLFYDKNRTKEYLRSELNEIPVIKDRKLKGQLLVHKGDVIDPGTGEVIASLVRELSKGENKNTNFFLSLTGSFMYVALCLSMVFLFLGFFRTGIFASNTQMTFIFMVMCLFMLACSIATRRYDLSMYGIPFAIAPVLIRAFFDTRTALFVHLNIIMLAALFTSDKYCFLFTELLGGVGAIFSIANLTRRAQLLVTSVVTLLINIAAWWAYRTTVNEPFHLADINPFLVASAGLLIAYPLIYVFEKLFGFISDFTLLELNDTGSSLLRQLSSEAPGTFQHSLQVANMAEEAIRIIGGNSLLVRTGAMYHDIGKLYNPGYFIENQTTEMNPHEDMSNEDSARIITGHVIRGVELARGNKLPEQVVDFIRTHHGTTLASFFYYRAKEENSGQLPDEKKFRYPGPIPFSVETGVLMLADSVEASSRTLKKYDAITIDDLVERIFRIKMDENQLINSDLTLRDLTVLKKVFKKKLMNMYHVRIEYPRS